MTVRALAALLLSLLLFSCNRGAESQVAATTQAKGPAAETATAARAVNVRQDLGEINSAIPIYAGATYREDLTRRDEMTIRNQYGAGAKVYTLASDDSYPQIYHYYTTYLAQFRGFPSSDTYPSTKDEWRTLQVQLNQAMQDPFVPGTTLALNGPQVILQISETEGEPETVIRYIVAPAGTGAPAPVMTASAGTDPQLGVAH